MKLAILPVLFLAVAGCIDNEAVGASGKIDEIRTAKDVMMIEKDERLVLEHGGESYRLIAPNGVKANALATVGGIIEDAFNERTSPGEKVAYECAISHYGGYTEVTSAGTASLDGYSMTVCYDSGGAGGRMLYLPKGVEDTIVQALDARGKSANLFNRNNGTVMFFGRAFDGGLVQIAENLMGRHPILVEKWMITGRTT